MPFELMVVVRLAKEGFGSLESILRTPTDVVLAAVEYSGFVHELQETTNELNRTDG